MRKKGEDEKKKKKKGTEQDISKLTKKNSVNAKSEVWSETTVKSMSRSCAAKLTNWFLGAGLGSIFGVHELRENMDKNTEMKMIEKYLMPHLLRW